MTFAKASGFPVTRESVIAVSFFELAVAYKYIKDCSQHIIKAVCMTAFTFAFIISLVF